MHRHRIEWLLDVAMNLLLRASKGETWAVVIVSIIVPSLLLLIWLQFRNFRRIAEVKRRAAELGDHWPPSAEEVARVVGPAPLELPGRGAVRETQKAVQLDK